MASVTIPVIAPICTRVPNTSLKMLTTSVADVTTRLRKFQKINNIKLKIKKRESSENSLF